MDEVRNYLHAQVDRHLSDLKELLRFPSVSALPRHRPDMLATAQWLADKMRQIGLDGVEIMETAGHPVVYGEWIRHPDKPTALVYGHYDVQPVDPVHLWQSDPFEPAERNGRLYARGVSDDKGQVILHLQAVEAYLATKGELPVNVKFLIEGEEEVGSPNLAPLIKNHTDKFRADVIVISDTSMIDHDLPTICTGLRGMAVLEVTLTTAKEDLHSGAFGGAVPNAIHVLCEMIASLRDVDGRITVPGFYRSVVDPTDEERTRYAALPFDEIKMLRQIGLPTFIGEPEFTPFERLTIRPTLEINGMWGGFLEEGTKTVIPNQAHAKITCRLVPNQDPDEIAQGVKKYLERLCPPYASVNVRIDAGARAWRVREGDTYVAAAQRALETVYNRAPALAPLGGSIPVVETFESIMGVPIVLMGFAPPDANAHAPNESFPLKTFHLGRESVSVFFQEIGDRWDGLS